jgi:hypothetical protein
MAEQRATCCAPENLMRKRAELLAHIQNTISQYNLPELSVNLSAERNRQGVAELRFRGPAQAPCWAL